MADTLKECPCCGHPTATPEQVSKYRRAMAACKDLSVWWDKAKVVISNGDAAHDLASIVMIGRGAIGLLDKKEQLPPTDPKTSFGGFGQQVLDGM